MTSLPAPRSQNPWQNRIVAAFTQRLVLKATAIFLAIVLWLVVNAKEPQTRLVSVRFSPTLLDSSLVLREPLPQITAIVAGTPKQLLKLSASPPTIRRPITADAPDTLVLDLRPEDVIMPEGVDAFVTDVLPKRLPLRFESTWSKKVPIVPSGIDIVAAPGTGTVLPHFEPETVQISGPRHLVLGVSSVKTNKTTIPFPDSLAHLVDIDTASLGPGIRVRPTQVKVLLTLLPHS